MEQPKGIVSYTAQGEKLIMHVISKGAFVADRMAEP